MYIKFLFKFLVFIFFSLIYSPIHLCFMPFRKSLNIRVSQELSIGFINWNCSSMKVPCFDWEVEKQIHILQRKDDAKGDYRPRRLPQGYSSQDWTVDQTEWIEVLEYILLKNVLSRNSEEFCILPWMLDVERLFKISVFTPHESIDLFGDFNTPQFIVQSSTQVLLG